MTEFTHPKDAPKGHKWQLSNGQDIMELHWFKCAKFQTISAMTNGGVVYLFNDFGKGHEWAHYLIDVPKERTVWLNIDQNGLVHQHDTKESAYFGMTKDIISCKVVTFTEGEFDE